MSMAQDLAAYRVVGSAKAVVFMLEQLSSFSKEEAAKVLRNALVEYDEEAAKSERR